MTDPTVAPLEDHPAKYSEPILEVGRRLLTLELAALRRTYGRDRVLEVGDVMAGVGRIHRLASPGRILTTGIEIEPPWAACHPGTVCADVFEWSRRPGSYERFDVIFTSPTYANRMADHHDAKDGSKRYSYKHVLGYMPTEGSSATYPWGTKYWRFHGLLAHRLYDMLRPGGLLLWNVSDFYKGDRLIPVVDFHRGALWAAGFEQDAPDRKVETRRLRGVGNDSTAKRASHEVILRFRKPLEGPHAP